MIIRITSDYLTFRSGQIVDVTDGMADILIRIKRAVSLDNKAIAVAPSNKALLSAPKNKAQRKARPSTSKPKPGSTPQE